MAAAESGSAHMTKDDLELLHKELEHSIKPRPRSGDALTRALSRAIKPLAAYEDIDAIAKLRASRLRSRPSVAILVSKKLLPLRSSLFCL